MTELSAEAAAKHGNGRFSQPANPALAAIGQDTLTVTPAASGRGLGGVGRERSSA
ncbi:MAG: hypothetical protein IPM76_20620 [Chloroflexi bacterium]|nr:hypothetical protein [Chloroflexota bacterium]